MLYSSPHKNYFLDVLIGQMWEENGSQSSNPFSVNVNYALVSSVILSNGRKVLKCENSTEVSFLRGPYKSSRFVNMNNSDSLS